jgi:hypothetical protein
VALQHIEEHDPPGEVSDLTWVIDQKDDALHISEISKNSDGKEVKTDFDCSTDGKECITKLDGQPAIISFYFNGAALVEMDYKGTIGKASSKKGFS